ncbi:hypothetical protein AGOR_G00034640 [Albula goreensis]|uniref:Perforin-1-like n=1 Tax=Albula goreensis TaxID=1534307 RepID=A0A8T3E3J8_9TELE|nr:hypothetical protein AGOR_G00034640 [Albula goreensis]
MEALWRILILAWACHFLSSPGVLGAKIIGTPQQCDAARFVPGYNLAGEGLDIVKMKRKGAYVINMEDWRRPDGTCTLMENSYLGGILQKLPLAVDHWRPLSKCKMSVSSKIYESSEAVVKDATSSIKNDWKLGLNLPVTPANGVEASLGGTQSSAVSYAMRKSKADKYSFTSHEVHCNFYQYSLATALHLHSGFLELIKRLPNNYNSETKTAYRGLIDTYGTHYITKVELGGKMKAVTAIQTCKATMKGLTETDVKDCLDVEASATLSQTASVKTEFHHCQELKKKLGTSASFSSMFSDRHSEVVGGRIDGADLLFSGESDPEAYKDWLKSLKTVPNIVFYSLKPLHLLLEDNALTKAGLKKAIEEYILENALVKKCSRSCQIGTRISARDPCACVCDGNDFIKRNCCPVEKGLATLKVYNLRGRNLFGDETTETDGSVQVTYDKQIKRTEIINNNNNPNWPEEFEFGPIKMDKALHLYFELYDADNYWNSDLLGKCSIPLHQGTVSDGCMFQHGTFFFSYEVTCAPSLGGPHCDEYIPFPMSTSLVKEFYSNNGFFPEEHSKEHSNRSASTLRPTVVNREDVVSDGNNRTSLVSYCIPP